MNYKNITDLNTDIIKSMHLLAKDVDLIIGVPRSGMLAASILATHTHLPLIDVDGFIHGRPAWFGKSKKAKKVEIWANSQDAKCPLLFDDCVSTGRSIDDALHKIRDANFKNTILTGTVYVKPGNEKYVDVFFQKLSVPRVFEWNLMHSGMLPQFCVDIDGVLCRDPDMHENDDGTRYKEFLQNVPAWHSPSVEIGWLVTSRLERYRQETEQWLESNNIRYKNLIMLDLGSAEERRKLGIHASFKADVYKKTKAVMFVESSFNQAIDIAKFSGKCVLCYENGQLVWPGGFQNALAKQKSKLSYGRWKIYVPDPLKVVYKKMKSFVA